jgi:hypothetical protein
LHDLLKKKAFKARCKTNVMANLAYVLKNRIHVLPSHAKLSAQKVDTQNASADEE